MFLMNQESEFLGSFKKKHEEQDGLFIYIKELIKKDRIGWLGEKGRLKFNLPFLNSMFLNVSPNGCLRKLEFETNETQKGNN